MEAVEYRTATLVTLTDRGEALLSSLALDGPTKIDHFDSQPVEIKDPPSEISGLLAELTPSALESRNQILGYVPRGNGETDVVQALQALVNASSPSISKAQLLVFAEKHFGVSESSFSAALTTLTKSGLIEQTSLNVYEPTPAARAWLETGEPLDLALVIHARYLFVLEIIPMLREHDRAPDLARAAVDYYGLSRADVGGVRTRLQVLLAAGLIMERANWRYQATPLGEEVAARFPLQAPRDVVEASGSRETGADERLERPGETQIQIALEISRDIVDAGRDSDSPIRLEQATARAFQFLGFEARHIGGGGKTDVLATVDNKDLKPVRIIVDAKSARSGSVSEGSVSFDTLRDHQAQHRADYVVLVGPGFDAGRVRARAEQNGVTLITTAEFAEVLVRHANLPLSPYHYLGLITGAEEDRRQLELRWSGAERRIDLLAQVVTVLAEEARDTDEITGGALTGDQIYSIAREGSTGQRPHPTDIEATLNLLQHPLVDSVRTVRADRGRPVAYHLVDTPALVQAKLATLARALDLLNEEAPS
ncbi:restriction endonuclease [Nocardia sp. NPDC001965]